MRPSLRPRVTESSMCSSSRRVRHLVHALDDLVEVEDHGLHDLVAAEDQELARDAGGALGGVLDFLGVAMQRIVGGELAHEIVVVADDDPENVVEVMGDAAGELAHDLHLLRLDELVLELAGAGLLLHVVHGAADG